MPDEMVNRAISGFPKRVRHCIASGGGPFKHRKLEDSDDIAEYPILSGQGEETDNDDEWAVRELMQCSASSVICL